MKRSVNEIQGLVLKAARGAGVPLGIAEDLWVAVPFILKNNALSDVVDVLEGASFVPLQDAVSALDARQCGQDAVAPSGLLPALYDAMAAARGVLPDCNTEPASGAQDVSGQVWARLNVLAKRTYVPSSEESRTAGAGAGLTDND